MPLCRIWERGSSRREKCRAGKGLPTNWAILDENRRLGVKPPLQQTESIVVRLAGQFPDGRSSFPIRQSTRSAWFPSAPSPALNRRQSLRKAFTTGPCVCQNPISGERSAQGTSQSLSSEWPTTHEGTSGTPQSRVKWLSTVGEYFSVIIV